MFINIIWGRDNSVGIATRYSLDCPGIESLWRRDFLHTSGQKLWPTQPPMQWVPGPIPGHKADGAWCWPSTPPSAGVKERVELYLYSPSELSWPVLGSNFLTLIYFTLLYILYNISVVKLRSKINNAAVSTFPVPCIQPGNGYLAGRNILLLLSLICSIKVVFRRNICTLYSKTFFFGR